MFLKLKNTLVESGYDVRLTNKFKDSAKGQIEPDTLIIFVNGNLELNDRALTLIHELFHEIFPEWDERRIEQVACRTFEKLTVSQLGFFQFFVLKKGEYPEPVINRRLSYARA